MGVMLQLQEGHILRGELQECYILRVELSGARTPRAEFHGLDKDEALLYRRGQEVGKLQVQVELGRRVEQCLLLGSS